MICTKDKDKLKLGKVTCVVRNKHTGVIREVEGEVARVPYKKTATAEDKKKYGKNMIYVIHRNDDEFMCFKQGSNKTLKKHTKNFIGECELRQLPKGTYFRVIDKNGKVSRETYTKDSYDKVTKKFDCLKHSDIWGSGRSIKGTQRVTTDFDY